MDGGGEDVKLPEETRRDGQAEKRKQKHGKGSGNPRLALAEAGVIVKRGVLFFRAAELRNDGEGADFHEGITQKVKENCGVSLGGVLRIRGYGGYGGERDEDVACVSD